LLGLAYGGRAWVTNFTERRRESLWGTYDSYERTVIAQEDHALPSALFTAVYASLGLEYRLGRHHPFWSQLSLGYELRPLMQLIARPGVPARFEGASQHLFGLRLNLR
jgi:hypothetical protein